jgi:hypothetical protein
MLYREIIAVCSLIHTIHTNVMCGQNVEFVNIILLVCIVTTGLAFHRLTSLLLAYMQKTGSRREVF